MEEKTKVVQSHYEIREENRDKVLQFPSMSQAANYFSECIAGSKAKAELVKVSVVIQETVFLKNPTT